MERENLHQLLRGDRIHQSHDQRDQIFQQNSNDDLSTQQIQFSSTLENVLSDLKEHRSINSSNNSNCNNNATSDFVTRAEMSQLILTIIQHYEKRITNLEISYQNVLTELQNSQYVHSNLKSERDFSMNESSSVKRLNQTSSLASLNQVGRTNSLFRVSQQQQQSQDIQNNQSSELKLNQNQSSNFRQPFSEQSQNIMSERDLCQTKKNLNFQVANSEIQQKQMPLKNKNNQNILVVSKEIQNFQGQKLRPCSQTDTMNSAATDKFNQYQNNSEIKGKINLFDLKQISSPSQQNMKQIIQKSPDNEISKNKTFKGKSEEKQQSKTQHSQNQEKANFNISLSILLEEDSNSQQLLSSANQKLASSLTYDERTSLKDQKVLIRSKTNKSNKITCHNTINAQSLEKTILQRNQNQQRSSTSLNSKISAKSSQHQSFQTVVSQVSKYTKSANKTQVQRQSKTQNAINQTSHSMIQNKQLSKTHKTNQQQNNSDLQRQLSNLQQNQNLQVHQNQQQTKRLSLSNDKKDQGVLLRGLHSKNQQINIIERRSLTKQSAYDNSTVKQDKNKNQILSNQSSLAKILIPVFASERNFKIKTPLGGLKSDQRLKGSSQNQNNILSHTPEVSNNRVIINDFRDSKVQNCKENFKTIQLDLPLMSKLDLLGNQCKTFDAANDPLTMRDLDIIEQNQFSIDNEYGQSSKTFDNSASLRNFQAQRNKEFCQSNYSGSFNHSKQISNSSQNGTQSQRDGTSFQRVYTIISDDESSIIHSGSMTSRDKPLQCFTEQNSTTNQSQNSMQIGPQNAKKRPTAASRLHGSKAESRLNNLVQTIQKYKDEQTVKNDVVSASSNISHQSQNKFATQGGENSIQQKQKDGQIQAYQKGKSYSSNQVNIGTSNQSLINQYNKFENHREEELKINDKNHQVTRAKSSKSSINNSCFVKGKKSSKSNSRIDLTDQSKNVKTNQENILIKQYEDDMTIKADEITCSQQDCDQFYYQSNPLDLVASKENSQQQSSAKPHKSRNYINYQEYFSFSNLENEGVQVKSQEDKEKSNHSSVKSLHTEASQKDLMDKNGLLSDDYKTRGLEEDYDKEFEDVYVSGGAFTARKIERTNTMVKITTVKDAQQKETYVPLTTFIDLTGDILDIISEYLPSHEQQIPPLFVMTNSTILANYAKYKRENFSIQNEILVDQIAELKRELFDYFDQKLFKMSKGLSIIYYSNINSKEWTVLEELCRDHLLNQDDVTLLRVYMLLLGSKPHQQSFEMQDQLQTLIREHKNRLNQIFNPELHFTFGPQILCQVGSLLQTFSLESYIINYNKPAQSNGYSRKIRTLQILAQIIYEALQFCKIVPNRIESDIRELERVIDLYSSYQDKLDLMISIKAIK